MSPAVLLALVQAASSIVKEVQKLLDDGMPLPAVTRKAILKEIDSIKSSVESARAEETRILREIKRRPPR